MNGIINVYKEAGYTSFDAVAVIRRITGLKKAGHMGTLDPDAGGVLPVCVGSATRAVSLIKDTDKTYRAVMLLGVTTDTMDVSGKVISKSDRRPDAEEIRRAVFSFDGGYDQIPPMYSALKVNGKRLYELARQGIEVDRKPRHVRLYDIDIHQIDLDLNEVTFTVSCSGGTYIRALCSDIGEKLGCGACMKNLLRTRVGRFEVTDSKKLSEIEALAGEGRLEEIVLPVDRLFEEFPAVRMKPSADRIVRNGNPFDISDTERPLTDNPPRGRVRVYASDGRFIGLYSNAVSGDVGLFKPEKMFP